DARERKLWEFLAPTLLQTSAVARRNGEEQLVILPFGDCIVDFYTATERQAFDIDLEPDFAGAREARQIDTESVTQIHHGVDRKVFGQPARFHNPRDKLQMLSLESAAERAGHKKII